MKGALGNALIMNMVITFILIFYVLLIGSMAYSKAFKVKNYLITSLVQYDELYGQLPNNETQRQSYPNSSHSWNSMVNDYLSKIGYILSSEDNTCPSKNGYDPKDSGYKLIRDTSVGSYNYCIYKKSYSTSSDAFAVSKYTYKVVSYVKFDFPVIGDYIKLPIAGETKTITKFE